MVLQGSLNATHFGNNQTMQMFMVFLRDFPFFYALWWWQLKIVFYVHPGAPLSLLGWLVTWGNDPSSRAYCSKGLFNHHLRLVVGQPPQKVGWFLFGDV